jgi:hypothetical protein
LLLLFAFVSHAFTIFFSVDNMSFAVSVTLIRLTAGQTTIGGSEAFSSFSGGRKLFLSGYRVDKTAPRLRRGWY